MENHKGNIVIVGVLDQPGSTNLYMAKAFEEAGYNVIPVNYRTIIPKFGKNVLNHLLYKLALDEPKLILFSKFNGVESLIIGKCSQVTKTWFWFMDGVNTLRGVPECVHHAQMATYSSFTGEGVLGHVKKQIGTGEGMFHIMEGIDKDIYRPTIVNPNYECDIAFIGTANKERVHYLEVLVKAGYTVKAFGEGFNAEVHGNDFNSVCASAKAMLALSAEYDTQAYFSDRVFRYGACGSLVFHKYAPGMDRYFAHGQDVNYFRSEEELLQLADYFIRQDRADERNTIIQNLYNKVLDNHTWGNVVQQICAYAEI